MLSNNYMTYSHLKEKLRNRQADRRTTDDGQRTIGDHYSSLETCC